MVYMLKEPRYGKFDKHYLGPYEIIDITHGVNAELRITDKKTKTVHFNKLKLATI